MDESAPQQQPNGRLFDENTSVPHQQPLFPQVRISPDYMPNGRKSLSSIAEHAFALGIVLSATSILTGQLIYMEHYLWRVPLFIAILCVFHFLEFDMTARYNPPDAKVSSFLLFTNGRAYNIAHTAAIIEVFARYWFMNWGYLSLFTSVDHPFGDPPLIGISPQVLIGLSLVIIGQTIRSLAMKGAGTSFNHVVQSSKKEDHILITTGVYALSRHPAYFGFFWWGLGTQIILGNTVCLVAYAAVLWKFFAHRIKHEEKHLIAFFGSQYETYRTQTPVRIPFIA